MKRITSLRRFYVSLAVLVLLAAVLAVPLCSNARASAKQEPAKDSGRTVRVGWYNSDHFQEGASGQETKSGYSYEYLQSIANYTGWDYEYVYEGWSDCYDALISGDIDFLAGVSYTKERSELMNYPGTEMGFESYYIYKKAGNEEIDAGDLSTLSGKRIGTIRNNLMSVYFESWRKEAGIDCKEVYFDDFQARDKAFERGEIDAFIAVNNNVPSNSGYSPVVMVGQDSYYLAVSKERTDLLEELNSTLSSINESNPYFTQSLQIKYFKNTAVNAALSGRESAWVKEHGRIKIGYMGDYMPFCGLDANGKITGVITDIMEAWAKELGLEEELPVEYIEYDSYPELLAGLQDEKVDVAFPISDSISYSEKNHIVQTNNLIESTIYLIYKGEYNDASTKTIAVADSSPFQRNYTEMNFPDSKIIVADGPKGCLDAVKEGKAGCTFFNSGRAEGFLEESEYESLSRLSLGTSVNYCLGVKKGNNVVYSLLERGVGLVDKSLMTAKMYKYVNMDPSYSLSNFIHENMVLVMTIVLIFIGLIMVVAVTLAVSLKKTREQNEKEQQMLEVTRRQNEELEETKEHLEEAVQRAESASNAKTTFLFNMSHDIRTPMNAILGFAHLAKESSKDEEKVVDYLNKIKDSGDVLLSILNNVLEMARIEKGTIVLEEEAVAVEPFVKTIATMFDEQMKQKNLSFDCTIDVKEPYVYCDETKLREILLNIISNAYKYTNPGGAVSVRVQQLPSEEEGIARIRTTVQDTGKGMSEDFLPTLFEEFAREKNASAKVIEGTGLGMAIVKSFVELMHGTIQVESELGVGTTIIIEIPHRIASREEAANLEDEVEEASYNFAGKRLLLAEDMEINAEIAKAMLQEADFEVEWAKDGQMCVDMLQEKPAGYYDAILMDIQMPKLNGYEASRAIRAMEDREKAGIPIIAMTANAFEEDRKNAFDAGMNGHLGKPIEIPEMMRTLHEILGAS